MHIIITNLLFLTGIVGTFSRFARHGHCAATFSRLYRPQNWHYNLSRSQRVRAALITVCRFLVEKNVCVSNKYYLLAIRVRQRIFRAQSLDQGFIRDEEKVTSVKHYLLIGCDHDFRCY